MNSLIKYAIITALCVAAVFGAYLFGKRTADREAYIASLQKELASLKSEANTLAQDRKDIQKDTSESVASVRQKRASITTPESAVSDINSTLQTHIGLVPQEQSEVYVPDAPSVLSIPKTEFPLITNAITNHKVLDISYQGCTKELSKCDEQLANKDNQIKNLEAQVKSQSPHRFRNCVARLAVGSIAGAISGKRELAIVGAGIGGASCFIW